MKGPFGTRSSGNWWNTILADRDSCKLSWFNRKRVFTLFTRHHQLSLCFFLSLSNFSSLAGLSSCPPTPSNLCCCHAVSVAAGLCGQLLAVSLRSRVLTEDMITPPPLLSRASAPPASQQQQNSAAPPMNFDLTHLEASVFILWPLWQGLLSSLSMKV